jgi:hypothetical protein
MRPSHQPNSIPSSGEARRRVQDTEDRGRQVNEPAIGQTIRWDRLYSILVIDGAEFAFSDYDGYVAALRAAWDAGLVPEYGSTVHGTDLPEAAPALRGVDTA